MIEALENDERASVGSPVVLEDRRCDSIPSPSVSDSRVEVAAMDASTCRSGDNTCCWTPSIEALVND
jgi:hypothetical protein